MFTELYWLSAVIGFIGGVLIGVTLYKLIFRFRSRKGILRIDHSNPEKDVYRFEIDGIVDTSTKRFILKVDHDADLSQEFSQE